MGDVRQHFIETKQFAWIKREYDENHKRSEYLCICEL